MDVDSMPLSRSDSLMVKDIRTYSMERIDKLLRDVAERMHDLIGGGPKLAASLFFLYGGMAERSIGAMYATSGATKKMSIKQRDDTILFAALYAHGIYCALTDDDRSTAPEDVAKTMFEAIRGYKFNNEVQNDLGDTGDAGRE